jgi:hypothetical protein
MRPPSLAPQLIGILGAGYDKFAEIYFVNRWIMSIRRFEPASRYS